MKKSILALAVLGIFAGAASAQTNVTIYGIVDAGVFGADNGSSGDNDKTWGVGSGMQSGSRLGFKGTEDLGGGLSAIFTLEAGFNVDNGTHAQGIPATVGPPVTAATDRLFGRQAFVGLNSGFGAVKLGRQYNPIRSAVESVDPFGVGLAGNAGNIFELYGERADNTLNYTSGNFGGFVGQLAYSFGEVAGDSTAGRQMGASGAYDNGPIRAVIAYHRADAATVATLLNKQETVMLGGSFNFGMAKLHAAYARNEGETGTGLGDLEADDFMIGVSAPFGPTTLLASYIRRSDDSLEANDVDQWAIGLTYAVSKRTNFYTSYAKIKNDGLASKGLGSAFNGNPTPGNDPALFNIGVRHIF